MTTTTTMTTTTMTTTTMTTGDTRRFLSSIRLRIVVGYVALLAAALAIAVLVTRQALLTRLDREIDESLVHEIEELRLLATNGVDPTTGEPFGTDVEAVFDTFFDRSVPTDDEAFYALVGGRPYLLSYNAPQELFRDEALMAVWTGLTTPTRGSATTAAGEVTYLAAPLYDSSEVGGVYVVVHFPEDDRDEVLQVVRIVTVAGLVVLIASAALAWSMAGRVLRPVRDLTSAARDITEDDLSRRIPVTGTDELAELGTTFNEMLDRLEQGFNGQRQFLDDVAHELRTPITIARGHLEVLGDDPQERAETVAIVTDELDRMNRYVDDLLVLAKAEERDFLRPEPVDLGEFADGFEQRVAGIANRRWTVDAAPPPGQVAIVADPGRLTQAMLNLASNAVEHTAEAAEIGFGVEAIADGPGGATSARLWVRDTGPGVDPASADLLFQRHFRGAGSRANRADGMGIGLSIVDAIARAHGGTVGVGNVNGGGARFMITIPAEPPTEGAST